MDLILSLLKNSWFVFFVYVSAGFVSKTSAFYGGGGFTFEIADNEKMCMYQQFAENGQKWLMSCRVVRGGNNDIDITIKNSQRMQIYKEQKKHIVNYQFETERGTFEFCFSNEFSTFTHKQVFLTIRPDETGSLVEEAGGVLVPRAETAMESSAENIHKYMSNTAKIQLENKVKNTLGFNSANILNSRAQWMSVAVMVAVIVTGFGQVYALRKLFPKNEKSIIKQEDNEEVTHTNYSA